LGCLDVVREWRVTSPSSFATFKIWMSIEERVGNISPLMLGGLIFFISFPQIGNVMVKMEGKHLIDLSDEKVIIKRYRIRPTGKNGASLETTIPREAFEREARRLSMSFQEALKKLDAVWRFNEFHGLHLSFERRKKK